MHRVIAVGFLVAANAFSIAETTGTRVTAVPYAGAAPSTSGCFSGGRLSKTLASTPQRSVAPAHFDRLTPNLGPEGSVYLSPVPAFTERSHTAQVSANARSSPTLSPDPRPFTRDSFTVVPILEAITLEDLYHTRSPKMPYATLLSTMHQDQACEDRHTSAALRTVGFHAGGHPENMQAQMHPPAAFDHIGVAPGITRP
ncbi:hypothetical protein C8Q78DRAFT_718323 [Trametes maxima]|nr:hypothetical protein C8Q78DRAFT_718323 [Trametes maxima]